MVVWWSAVICLLKYATMVMPPSYYFCISIAFTSKELVSLGSSVNCFGSKIIVVNILFASRKSCFCLSPQHHVTSFLVSHVIKFFTKVIGFAYGESDSKMILLFNNFLTISRWSFFPAPRGNTDASIARLILSAVSSVFLNSRIDDNVQQRNSSINATHFRCASFSISPNYNLNFAITCAEPDIPPRRDFLPPERRTLVKYQTVSTFNHDYMIL